MSHITVSDYAVLRDSTFTLDAGDTEDFQWHVPEQFLFSPAFVNRAVIAFKIRPQESSRLRVTAAGSTTIINANFSASHTRMYQEVFRLDNLAGQDVGGVTVGSVFFEFRAVSGRIHISDVVLHFKRFIDV